jgi:hypothetical protein
MKRPSITLVSALAAALLLTALLVHPNPFGNIPEGIRDESLFATTALLAFTHHTLPGLAFVTNGAPYGIVTVHLTTVLVGSAIAWEWLATGSRAITETWTALHIGDLTNLVRLSNALFILMAACLMLWQAYKERKKDSEALSLAATLMWLLLGDSLFVTIAPTGKVWVIVVVLEIAAAWLVARQERLQNAGQDRMASSRYASLLVWIGFIAFLQNYPGGLTFLWALYAVWLGHLKWRELLRAVWRALPIWILIIAANLAVYWRSLGILTDVHGLTAAAKTAFLTPTGATDWPQQLYWIGRTAVASAPLALAVVLVLFVANLVQRRLGLNRERRWPTILYLQVLATFTVYHVVFGLARWPRYVLPLTVELCIAAVLLPKPAWARRNVGVVAIIIGCMVGAKAASLWWTPSADLRLVEFLRARASANDTMLVQDHYLKLPPNVKSLATLDPTERQTGRAAVMLAHPSELKVLEPFSPLVLYGKDGATVTPSQTGHTWIIAPSDGTNDCHPGESNCWAFVSSATGTPNYYSQEGEILPGLFSAERLGGRYFLRQL